MAQTLQPSASKLDLLQECAYPFGEGTLLEEKRDTAASEYGTAFHDLIARLLRSELTETPTERLEDTSLQKHVAASFAVLSKWLRANNYNKRCKRFVETSFAYCPDSGQARAITLQLEGHIYLGLRSDEIGGTGDLIVVPNDVLRPILVLDHKTGMMGDFTRPHSLPQLSLLGAAACYYYKRNEYIPAILHTPKDGLPVVYASDEPVIGVSAWNALWNRQLSRIGDGTMRPGKHCKYCPAKVGCPTQHADLLKSAGSLVEKANLIGSELVMVDRSKTSSLSREENIGRLHLLFQRFSQLKDAGTSEMRRALQNDPSLEPVRPDGKRLRLKTRSIERISKATIVKALGTDAAERLFIRLRKQGALETSTEVCLVAE